MDPTTLKLMMGAAGAASPAYVEDVFSTWLYTGNGSTQPITNGIDLAGEGGLVWTKPRVNDGVNYHALFDTARGAGEYLSSNLTSGQNGDGSSLSAFGATGFTLGNSGLCNGNSYTYASWTFRKAAKFFDVVTYTGDGTNDRLINHSLGSQPGCIIIKRTDTTSDWSVIHRSAIFAGVYGYTGGKLNSTAAFGGTTNDDTGIVNTSSTQFEVNNSVGSNFSSVNASGATYVAYLFAHDAGGFGDSGNDSVVSCGSYTGNGSTTGPVINLGWEPQWILVKNASGTYSWYIIDSMRGITTGGNDAFLMPNESSAEFSNNHFSLTATGFQPVSTEQAFNQNGSTYIYIAIRRGPMKTPTDATKVFSAIAASGSTGTSRSIGFPSDFVWARRRDFAYAPVAVDRLRGYSATSGGSQPALETTNTGAENPFTTALVYDVWNDTAKDGALLGSTSSALWYHFRRAPGYMDVVAYTGTGSARTVSHNLGVVPELMIVKCRSGGGLNWAVYNSADGATKNLALNTTAASATNSGVWNDTTPTASVFSVGTENRVNLNGETYIAYLFATCPGVSKVGSYTGTGTTLSVDCGFTAGSRFVLIKRTDSTGDWYVWDSARGIIAGDDPYLLLNSTAAEVTNTDYIDTSSAGFEISSTAPAAINANGGSFIFLAVA